jgi:hypothetical protein
MANNVVYEDGARRVLRHGGPTHGGAIAAYAVEALPSAGLPSAFPQPPLLFQYDTVPKVGVYGWTNEALLAVVIDRLHGFQAGSFPCQENVEAIDHAERALLALQDRTKHRAARGVEGQHVA